MATAATLTLALSMGRNTHSTKTIVGFFLTAIAFYLFAPERGCLERLKIIVPFEWLLAK